MGIGKMHPLARTALTAVCCVAVCAAALLILKGIFARIDSAEESGREALSKTGSRSEEVVLIQKSLRGLGYYTGEADGIYGVKTKEAVMRFQRIRGLEPDGIAGTRTLAALGIEVPLRTASAQNDVDLLARLISADARGEPYAGQVAVGAVVLNRVSHPSFPGSITGVIYQPLAFSCISDGQFNEPVADSAYRAARDALAGVDPTNGALYYYNPVTAKSEWIRNRPVILQIGAHLFCN